MITHNEQGRTMLEMLGVIAIMGIIVYGAIAGINYGMSSYKINQTYTEIQNIVQGVQDLYSWTRGYPVEGEMMNAACENDIFSMPCTGSHGAYKAQSQFGEIKITPTSGKTSFTVLIQVPSASDRDRLTGMDWHAVNIEQGTTQGTQMEFKPL